MKKSSHSTKVMPHGYTYPTVKPASSRVGSAPEKACPVCADHGSAVDKSVPRSKMFPVG